MNVSKIYQFLYWQLVENGKQDGKTKTILSFGNEKDTVNTKKRKLLQYRIMKLLQKKSQFP